MADPTAGPAPDAGQTLHRKCACGGSADSSGECKERREKKLQRKAAAQSSAPVALSIVHETLRSPGQPLDAATRAFMEPRFGTNFGQVRIHTDATAAESARAVNAKAFTVRHRLVFGADQYAPGTSSGRKLLAHELAHVVQQRQTATVQGNSMRRKAIATRFQDEPTLDEVSDIRTQALF
jgi:Domain of unknown function (DUF4157)